jgi:glucosyl-dolichyl phosphate glucuronosyltransferase
MTRVDVDISVIICAYTELRWDSLVAAVESVKCQSIQPREIIVVIDHNLPLFERVRRSILDVVLVENKESQGLSGARNSGVSVACGSVVAFLDEDAIAASDWLERLAVGYSEADVLGVGGAIEPLWLGAQPSWFPQEFYWVIGCTYRGMPQTTASVRNLIGCNMSFPRELFERVGGFRHEIGRVHTQPFGCEETEFCIRVRQRWPEGIIRYDPGVKVFHEVPAHRATWNYFCSRCYAEGLSKAYVVRLIGMQLGLAAERAYTLRILPTGITQGLVDTFLHRDVTGVARAAAIIAGLGLTTAGYLVGIFAGLVRSQKVVDLERNQFV